jgi:hypothetical protein
MPTEYNDDDSLEKYIDVCAHLHAIIIDSCISHVIIAGDFNCQPGRRFYGILSHLIRDNDLVETDIRLLSVSNDVFTYCSDNGATTSWIDHVLCSYDMNNKISDLSILYDVISSDHRPLSFVLNCHCQLNPDGVFTACVDKFSTSKLIVHDWSKIDSSTVNFYSNVLADRLDRIVVPLNLRSCCYIRCNDHSHSVDIGRYYN